ncbi:MAG TPA: B12-binding domain-containing radical SAM protein [Myxococcales bacterium]|nr:B12-binding domain-containing radical SAM protein [Myxococcales bacterium]HAN32479.1 B12-binding domain-containing radical SAM protein [Myxococcales bacterium]
MSLLLTHGYYMWDDPHERQTMRPYPPLGLLYIASHLESRGIDVEVFDSTFQDARDFQQRLESSRPSVVGIYVNMMTRVRALKMLRACKQVGAKVVVGGPDPANWVEHYLDHGADAVAIGEGEQTLEELLTCWQGDGDLATVTGIVWRDGDETIKNLPRAQLRNLDEQPFPARHLIDIDAYLNIWRQHHGQGSVSLITARGCPFQCTWCSHAVYGHSHRRRNVSNVADEVEHIIERYDPELLWYADDVFTIHKRWLRQYADELARRGLRVPFETITREDRLDDEVMDTLAEMGCFRIWVGAESGSQRILDAMKRKTDAERVIEMVHGLQKRGIQAGMFIMLGYDGETLDDLQETVAILKRAAPDVFLTTVSYPIKNTPYFEQVKDRIVATRPWSEGSDRDFDVLGRHSKRYYDFTTRWMVNSVSQSQLAKQRTARAQARRLKAAINAQIGRVGMWMTENERIEAKGRPVGVFR